MTPLGRAIVPAVVAIAIAIAAPARSEYSPRMQPGHLRARHASWLAAAECRAEWPANAGAAVVLRIAFSRAGRALRVDTEPDVPAFARCVLGRLRPQRFSVSGEDARGPEWVVVSRYVFPPAP